MRLVYTHNRMHTSLSLPSPPAVFIVAGGGAAWKKVPLAVLSSSPWQVCCVDVPERICRAACCEARRQDVLPTVR